LEAHTPLTLAGWPLMAAPVALVVVYCMAVMGSAWKTLWSMLPDSSVMVGGVLAAMDSVTPPVMVALHAPVPFRRTQ
jgi:hypothetical protein